MVVDATTQPVDFSTLNLKKLADRRFGIGFDQLLIVEKSEKPDVDFRYRIFNADGGEVEQCGNGARCFAHFVREQNLSEQNPLNVETMSGIISLDITASGQVRVDMGAPVFEAARIPVSGDLQNNMLAIKLNNASELNAFVVSMGNPHAVLTVEAFSDEDILFIGKALQQHEAFPNRVNIGFMQVVNKNEIKLRVFERGVGETLACGTGACAAVVAGIQQGLLNNKVKAHLLGGELDIEWQGENSHVFMQGDATLVYSGEINLNAFK